MISSTIRLLDDRTYRGHSRGGTVLKQAAGANLDAMLATQSWVDNVTYTSTNIRIEQLTLDGNRSANTGTVPLVLRTWNSRVYDVEIREAPGDGIRVTSLSRNGTHLSGTQVNSIIADVFVHDNGGHGIHVVDPDNTTTDWILERAWIAGSDGSGVDLDNAAGWQIRDLHIYGADQHAINARRCFNTGIHDNYIEDFGSQGTSGTTYFGIRCTVQGDVGSTISGNKINQMFTLPAAGSFVSIGLDGVNYGTGRVTVTGNTVIGKNTTRETGLSYAKGGGTALVVVSTGNLVDRVGTARASGTGVTVTAGQ
ncbi:right-handed parallel beta-helix repeat-containing protein [Dactylosporangium matsuzakiense]|nr:right-handed parallel beta-helix repeat-containing protein [Dactylosporangium matsuzakiense]